VPRGVRVHVQRRPLEVVVVLDRTRVEAAAEEVAPAVVARVEALRVQRTQPVHAAREPLPLGLDDEVVVVGHEDEHEHPPGEPALDLGAAAHPGAAVVVVADDGHRPDAARGDVERPALRQERPWFAGHVATVAAAIRLRRPCGESARTRHDFVTAAGTVPRTWLPRTCPIGVWRFDYAAAMKAVAAVAAAALALAAPAAAALPHAGVLVPGRSLGGLRIGAPATDVLTAWGREFGVCTDCTQPTWYFNYARFKPEGAAATFANGRVAALYTLWSPPGWHTNRGVAVGDPAAKVTRVYGPLDRRDCSGYYALLVPARGAVTTVYVLDDEVFGFGLSAPGTAPCR
jgi:hypothetical protein